MEVAGDSVDIVKLGWGTALVTDNLRAKLARYAAHGIPVVLGGTLTEIAIRDGRLDALIAWLRELGLTHVEISDGTIDARARAQAGAHPPPRRRGLRRLLRGGLQGRDARSWRPTAGSS